MNKNAALYVQIACTLKQKFCVVSRPLRGDKHRNTCALRNLKGTEHSFVNYWFNVYGTSSENKTDFDSLRRILDFLGVLLYIQQFANTMLAKASSEAGRRIASGCVLINSVVAKHLENLIFKAQNQNPFYFT